MFPDRIIHPRSSDAIAISNRFIHPDTGGNSAGRFLGNHLCQARTAKAAGKVKAFHELIQCRLSPADRTCCRSKPAE
jgi:hypothetical protein